MDNKPKRILKASNPTLFVGDGGGLHTFRLDVRDEGSRRSDYFSGGARPGTLFGRQKLFHYIAAGGMKQLRRTSADDLAQHRMQTFLVYLALGAALWLFFYFLPIC
jgi:hypothetical protein